jgi:hypothetical protein
LIAIAGEPCLLHMRVDCNCRRLGIPPQPTFLNLPTMIT